MKPLPKIPVLTTPLRGLLCFWALAAMVLGSLFPVASAHAQFPVLINRADWWRNGSTLDLDFAKNRYWLNGTSYTTIASFISGAGATFTRNSSATYFDSSGVLQTAAANTPRLDYEASGTGVPLGVLIEEARTNAIRNPRAEGAVAGTPGTPPTYWNYGSNYGITITNNGVVTVNNIPCLQLNFSGTATSSAYLGISFDSNITPPSLPVSTNYTQSQYVQIVSGSVANAQFVNRNFLYDTTNAVVGGINQFFSPSNSLTRITSTSTTPSSGNAPFRVIAWQLLFFFTSGSTYNFTLNIGAPQQETGAFATSVIFPPVGSPASATRAKDVFTVPVSATGANGAWYTQGVGTLGAVGSRPDANTGTDGYPGLATLDDGTTNNALQLYISTLGQDRYEELRVSNSSVYSPGITSPDYVARSLYKPVMAFQNGSQGAAIDGTLQTAGTVPTIPTFTRLSVGALRGQNNTWTGWVNRIWYMPTREPDHTLADYTR